MYVNSSVQFASLVSRLVCQKFDADLRLREQTLLVRVLVNISQVLSDSPY